MLEDVDGNIFLDLSEVSAFSTSATADLRS